MTTDGVNGVGTPTERRAGARPPYAGTRAPRLAQVPAFVESIAKGWGPQDRTAHLIPGTAEAAASHRERLAQRLPGETVVVASGTAPSRNEGNDHLFRADSNYVWLTGNQTEEGYLVLRAPAGSEAGAEATLYLPRPFEPGENGFFGDASHGALWTGPQPRLEDWADALSLPVRPLTELDAALATTSGALASVSVPDTVVERFGLRRDERLAVELAVLRIAKDDWEIAQLREAVRLSIGALEATVQAFPRAVADGLGERWLQGTFDRYARTFGNGTGYSSIAGAGAHAAILHWMRCDGQIRPDDAVLLDMGVESRSLYTGDLTRTYPASGTFTPAQREVYAIVERAHRAAIAQVRPGVEYLDFHFAAMEQIALGLDALGLLPVSVDEALSPEGQQHRRFIVCGLGHHLGLDVHDSNAAPYEQYFKAPYRPGNVFTIEPGLYFHPNDETVPPELRGIGVRIEDDILVTDEGHEVLSAELPFAIDEVEAWTKVQLAHG